MIEQFEKSSYRMSCRVFFVSDHSMITLDDDLYGTRANDCQVKTLSARKADREGHCAIVVADALFRTTLGVRFLRRGEPQDVCVDKLLESLLADRGELNINKVVLTADRGFGKLDNISKLSEHGFNVIYILKEHLLPCHPFVGLSFLEPGSREGGGEESSTPASGDADYNPWYC